MSPKRKGRKISRKFKFNRIRACFSLMKRVVSGDEDLRTWVSVEQEDGKFAVQVKPPRSIGWFEASLTLAGPLMLRTFKTEADSCSGK